MMKFTSVKNNLILGDDNYCLTDLTESSRAGRGVRLEQNIGKLSIGTFLNYPRFYPHIKKVISIYSSYNYASKYKLSAGYLVKDFDEGKSAHLISISGSARPYSWISLDSEFANGIVDGNYTNAYKGDFKTNYSFFRTFINFTIANEKFPGYFSNTRNLAGGLNMNIKKRTSLSFNYNSNYSNMALDTMFSNAPYTENITSTLGFKFNKNHSIGFSIVKRSSQDRLETKLFDFEETTTRINFSSRLNKFELRLSGGYGMTKNFLEKNEGESINITRARFSLKYQITEKIVFDAFLNYHANQRFLVQDLKDFYYGGAINTEWEKVSLVARYQSNYQIEEYYKDRSILDFSFNYRINSKNNISAVTYYNLIRNSYNNKELKILIRYTYTINVPVSRKGNIGSIKGRIINNGVENIEGIVITYCGDIAITDKKGRFKFPLVKAGEGYLFINESEIGLNSIAETPGPYKIKVVSGQENKFEIAYTKSARITGKIIIEEDINKNNNDYVSVKEELENLIIEAKKDNETFRVITKQNGEFSFEDLRPGTWIVQVYKTGLPKGYELIADTYNLTLSTKQEKVINVMIKKKSRKVKFQNSFKNLKK